MREVVAAEFGIKLVQLASLLRPERPSVGTRGEFEQPGQLERLCVDEPLLERGGAGRDLRLYLVECFEQLRPVLRGKLGELLVHVHHLDRIAADEQELFPEPVEFGGLRAIEHELLEQGVVAVEDVECDRLVVRPHLRVTERRRKQPPHVGEGFFEMPPSGRVFRGHERKRG